MGTGEFWRVRERRGSDHARLTRNCDWIVIVSRGCAPAYLFVGVPMPAFYDLNLIEQMLGITNSSQSLLLEGTANGVVEQVKNLISSPLSQQTITEYYSGNGQETLKLRWRPIVKTGLVVIEDVGGGYGGDANRFPASGELTIGVDYDVNIDGVTGYSMDGILYRINNRWASAWRREPTRLGVRPGNVHGSIKVTYTAGFSDADWAGCSGITSIIMQAIAMETAAQYRMQNGIGPITSESLNGYNYSRGGAANVISASNMNAYGGPRMVSVPAYAMLQGAGLIDHWIR